MTHPATKRICIVGPGAVGLDLGAHLLNVADTAVSFLGRDQRVRALRAGGINWRSSERTVHISPEKFVAVSDSTELGPQDYVFITAKVDAILSLAPDLVPLLQPDTVVVSAMNGIPPWYSYLQEKTIAKHLLSFETREQFFQSVPPKHILGMIVKRNVETEALDSVRWNAGVGYTLGEPNHTLSPRLDATANLLRDAGFAVTLSDNIHREIWHKLLVNVAVNPLSVITSLPIDEMLSDPSLQERVRLVVRQTHALGEKLGVVESGDFDVNAFIEQFRTARPGMRTSMYRDYIRGQPLEAGRIVDVILMLAALPTIQADVWSVEELANELKKRVAARA